MNLARMETIYEVLLHQGALAALRFFSEAEIRVVARRYGVNLPDRPLQPSEETQRTARENAQNYRAWRHAQTERTKHREAQRNKLAKAMASAAKRRAQRFTSPVSDEDERHARAFDDAVNVLDRPRWVRADAAQRQEKIEARVPWTFAAGSDDHLATKASNRTLIESLDDVLQPNTVFAARDAGAYLRPLPRELQHPATRGRFNNYLMALDQRVQTFEDTVMEDVDTVLDYDFEDHRSRLMQLAVADEVPHLTTCWEVS